MCLFNMPNKRCLLVSALDELIFSRDRVQRKPHDPVTCLSLLRASPQCQKQERTTESLLKNKGSSLMRYSEKCGKSCAHCFKIQCKKERKQERVLLEMNNLLFSSVEQYVPNNNSTEGMSYLLQNSLSTVINSHSKSQTDQEVSNPQREIQQREMTLKTPKECSQLIPF